MEPFNSFFNCLRGLDFHDNDLQFVTTSGANSNLEKLMSQNNRMVYFPKHHLTLLPDIFVFQNTAKHVYM